MHFDELLETIVKYNGLDDNVAKYLGLKYKTYTGEAGKTKWVHVDKCKQFKNFKIHLGERHSDGSRQLNIYNVSLEVYQTRGETIVEDVSCDSKFMLNVMDDVGNSIHKVYSWVSAEDIIILIMDNVGRHGTDYAVQEYTETLLHQGREISR
jgi:hypothetical protein